MGQDDHQTNDVGVMVTLSEAQVWHYAQFLKRVCLSDYEQRAASEQEAYGMLGAGEKIRDALREKGYAPH